MTSFRHCVKAHCSTEMANIEQTQQMVPFITCELFLGKNVDKWVLGVDVFDLDYGVHSDSIDQRIKRNSVDPDNLSHCRTPFFNDDLVHCLIVCGHMLRSFLSEELTFVPQSKCRGTIQHQFFCPRNDFWFCCAKLNCFWHIQFIGTTVWLPTTHNVYILESLRSCENGSLQTVPICRDWQCFPHNNTDCFHMFDEWKIWNDSVVWLKLQSNTFCNLTFWPQNLKFSNTCEMRAHFETILPRNTFLILWNERQSMELLSRYVWQHSFVQHFLSWSYMS